MLLKNQIKVKHLQIFQLLEDIYLNSKIFQYLKLGKKGFGNEIQLTDSLVSLIDSPGLYATEFDGKRFDCGNKLGFIEANINFGINDKEINKNLRKIIKKL